MNDIEAQRDLVERLQQEVDEYPQGSAEDYYDRKKLVSQLEDARNDLADMEEGIEPQGDGDE